MRLTEPLRLLALLVAPLCGAAAVGAAPAEELADLAARIEYGYYTEEPRVIEAARAVLERFDADDAEVRYYSGFAAFRLAQLAVRAGADAGPLAAVCIDKATPPRDAPPSAEAWVLVAACAGLDAQARRRDQALERARALSPDNPRLALLEAWIASSRPAETASAQRDEAAARFQHAVEAFDAWPAAVDGPDWGEAEAVVALGEIALARGEARAARDLLERALLLAPDYRLAVDLRAKLQASHTR